MKFQDICQSQLHRPFTNNQKPLLKYHSNTKSLPNNGFKFNFTEDTDGLESSQDYR